MADDLHLWFPETPGRIAVDCVMMRSWNELLVAPPALLMIEAGR